MKSFFCPCSCFEAKVKAKNKIKVKTTREALYTHFIYLFKNSKSLGFMNKLCSVDLSSFGWTDSGFFFTLPLWLLCRRLRKGDFRFFVFFRRKLNLLCVFNVMGFGILKLKTCVCVRGNESKITGIERKMKIKRILWYEDL